MNAEEIQLFSQSIALHPVVAIGGLMVLIFIARRNDLNYKKKVKASQGQISLEREATSKSNSEETDNNLLST